MKPPIIEVRQLSKLSSGAPAQEILKQINFSIQSGDIFGVVGASGAGKSTLMRCLTGLEKPTQGSIIIEGVDIAALPVSQLASYRKKIGMVFQQFNLFPSRTVAENIAFPMEIHGLPKNHQKKRIDELLELVGLSSKKHAYPATLSGGEKQRVGIARALANNPHILFCDEATSALDPASTRSILNLLLKLNEQLGLTIVIITHELDAIKQISNRMAVIADGELVEQGDVADIFAKPLNAATKQLLHPLSERLPPEFLEGMGPQRRLVSLTFKGEQAKQPLISQLVKEHAIEVNILLARIDTFQKTVLGSLVVELTGSVAAVDKALDFLESQLIDCEVLA
jgi:D-methionine transport system ATP-binding protein